MQSQGFGSTSDLNIGLAIYLPQITSFEGNYVSSVKIGLKSEVSNLKIFVSESLEGEPSYVQDVPYNSVGWNEITLDEKYPVTDKPLYVGYTCSLKGGDFAIGISTNDPCENAFFMNTGSGFTDVSLKYSPVSIMVTVSGENFKFDAAATDYVNHTYVRPGEKIPVTFDIANTGINEINSLEAELSITGTDQTIPVTLNGISIPRKGKLENQSVEFEPLEEGTYDIQCRITKVNGKDNEAPETGTFSQRIYVMKQNMTKSPVCEKLTGNTCQYCPRGIVAFDKMFSNYPDFIGISVDCYSDMDPLFIREYSSILQFSNSAPSFILDRKYVTNDMDMLEDYYKQEQEALTWAELKVEADRDSYKNNNLDVTVRTTFDIDQEETHFRIILVAIENEVRSYQYNGYANGVGGEMGGWEKLGTKVDTTFNDVARRIINFDGIENSIPDKVTKGESYEFNYTMDLYKVANIDKTEIIAMLLNTENGQIVNAAKVKVTDDVSINGLVSEPVSCYVSDGYLNLSFDGSARREISLYGIDGSKVMQMNCTNSEESFNVSDLNGVYVVSITENGKSIYKNKIVIY